MTREIRDLDWSDVEADAARMQEAQESGDTLDLDLVVDLVRRAGVHSYVEQTGGGCATIFAGARRPHPADTTGRDVLWACCAGPGTYGWGQVPSVADPTDFYVGADDEGESMPLTVADVGAFTEEAVARLIVAQATQADPTTPLSTTEALEVLK